MKVSKFTVANFIVAIGLFNNAAIGQTPMGTDFTYQGQLDKPVSGTFDIQFSLWDEAESGNQIGSMIVFDGGPGNPPSVMVTNGLFAVQLNENGEFGSEAFSGHARWLQIAVRRVRGGGAYTTQSPRESVTSAPYALHARGTIGVINVRDFGAVGDGDRDDTAAIQIAILAAPPGATVWFPSPEAYYRVSERLTITKSLTLLGDGAELRLENPEALCESLIWIRADNVSVRGLKLVGLVDCENPAVCVPGPGGELGLGIIDARGTGASDRISGLRIVDNEIVGIGYDGIFLWYVNEFQISGNRIEDMDHTGVEVLASQYGVIAQNHIRNITGINTAERNAFGIALSGCLGHDEPRCTDITVSGNTVEDIPTWHAYDTHGGQRIAFVGNTALRTKRGIQVGSLAGSQQPGNLAPLDITVVGNVFDSGVTDGSAFAGISFTGSSLGGVVQQYATGVISGNVVRGYGDQTSSHSGGMRIRTTRGLQVVGNTVIEPSSIGIDLENDNLGATVSGNTIVDPWTDIPAGVTTTGISVRAQNNTVHIGDNTITCGDKMATVKCELGVRIANFPTNVISLGVNHTEGMMAALFDATTRASARFAILEAVASSNNLPAGTFINGGGSGPGVLIQAGSGGAEYAILDVQTGAGASKFLVRGDGKVGIGRDPTANRLEVEGEASKTLPGHWLLNSDARIKTDVRTIGGALEKLDKVRLVEFRYTDDYRAAHPSIPDRAYVNVIAQEFATVFPEWVRSSGEELPTAGRERAGDPAGVDEILQVDPYPLTIYSAAAVQELHRKFTTLEEEWGGRRGAIERLQCENAELRARLTSLEELLATRSSGK